MNLSGCNPIASQGASVNKNISKVISCHKHIKSNVMKRDEQSKSNIRIKERLFSGNDILAKIY